MPVCASLCRSLCRPTARAQPNAGRLRGCLKSPAMSVFGQCGVPLVLSPNAQSPVKSTKPNCTWTSAHAATETFQTASEKVSATRAFFAAHRTMIQREAEFGKASHTPVGAWAVLASLDHVLDA